MRKRKTCRRHGVKSCNWCYTGHYKESNTHVGRRAGKKMLRNDPESA